MNPAMVLRAVAVVCLLTLSACGDKHEPVKPTVLIDGQLVR